MGFFDFGTIFFLIAAVVIFFQLRNVLGRRTGSERPPFDPYATRTREDAARSPRMVAAAQAPARRPAADTTIRFANPRPTRPRHQGVSTRSEGFARRQWLMRCRATAGRKTLKNLLASL